MAVSSQDPLLPDSPTSSLPKVESSTPTPLAAISGRGGTVQPPSTNEAQVRCIAEVNALFAEAAGEWQELQDAIQELRAELAPEELSEALAVAGLTAVKEAGEHPSAGPSSRREVSPLQQRPAPEPRALVGPAKPTRTKRKLIGQGLKSRAMAFALGICGGKSRKETGERISPAIAGPRQALGGDTPPPPESTPSTKKETTEPALAEVPETATPPAAPAQSEVTIAPTEPTAPAFEATLTVEAIPAIELTSDESAAPVATPPPAEAATAIEQAAANNSDGEETEPSRKGWRRRTKKASVDKKLEEVLDLLRGGLRTEPGARLPNELTDQIAREVAGRLKQTVAESLRGATVATDGGTAPAPTAEPKTPARIPMGDVQAIIDQLTQSQ